MTGGSSKRRVTGWTCLINVAEPSNTRTLISLIVGGRSTRSSPRGMGPANLRRGALRGGPGRARNDPEFRVPAGSHAFPAAARARGARPARRPVWRALPAAQTNTNHCTQVLDRRMHR